MTTKKHVRRFTRRAKIIGTIGPKSWDTKTLEKLILAGVNVARLNMSHGDYDTHKKTITNIRQASKNLYDREVAILMDLQGPKIRVDKLEENLQLKKNEVWYLGLKEKNKDIKNNFIPTVYKKIADDCDIGSRILFDDGLIVGMVTGKTNNHLIVKIDVGGLLKSNKGINLPDTKVSASSFSQKDQSDLEFGIKNDVDYCALSFVRNRQNIDEVREFLKERNANIPIISKVENPEAIENIEEIIEASDVIMIARGDMGVELGNHLVPSIQKRIIMLCNAAKVPVITATQMLETMTTNSSPTRAEASDVANAIWDGTDAVMLSGETANGDYPVETVLMMDKIVEEAEKHKIYKHQTSSGNMVEVEEAIMYSASRIAEKIGVERIVAITVSGKSCLKSSLFRPRTSILGVTYKVKTARKMCLYWGVSPFLIDNPKNDQEDFQCEVIELIKEKLGLKSGEKIVITRGTGKLFKESSTNSIQVKII